MYIKADKSESERVTENSRIIPLEPEKDQQEGQNKDPIEKKSTDESLSEKFFLSDPPLD